MRARSALALALLILATPGTAGVKEYCANQWPTDFEMQEYCIKQQYEAVFEIKIFAKRFGFWGDNTLDGTAVQQAMSKKNPWTIMIAKCFTDWDTDAGIDYEMVAYCPRQQEKSYHAIQ